ncbi:malic enzyme, NAD binding domain protein [Ancylostoma caninum]|uniref:Malic enzyme n=1 Tax=Ancylostoma caninum TaxID=29170 RepID=A0A368GSJ5_ANCCA|nr:malic enzyme, NAD binding domain protein [Ancylostoma caninum]
MLSIFGRCRYGRHARDICTTASTFTSRNVLKDPKKLALHKLYRPERVTPNEKGYALLNTARINKGMAFTLKERQYLGIHGLLPPAFMSQEQQVYRTMKRIRDEPDNLEKYIILDELQCRTEKLFYRVLCENVKELMPIVYTPTVGLACQKFGAIYRHPKGLYVTINDNSISKIYQILSNWPVSDVQAIVVTDGERILGLGDLGAYGMGIPVGKLALYVALAGIQPRWCLPVLLDVGTNNQKLLDDPFYIGLRRNRVRGEEYDRLIDNFMKAVTKKFGRDTLIQFEDFAFQNAFTLLDRYKNEYCTFNDDIQGTAAVAVAGLLATTRVTKKKLSEQKIVFLGAGAAGLGIAELIVTQMMEEGLSREDARANIFLLNSKGLITKDRAKNLSARHQQYAKDLPETASLLEVVKMVKPNALLGLSTVGGAFTPEILQEMAKINPRPIIFALSNPTNKAECTAEAAYQHTNGTVLFASGSPFDNVEFNGRLYKPGQGNNSYIFPGVALGAILFKAKHIPEKAFLIAARRVAASVTEKSLNEYSRLYPRLKDIRELSVKIALDIGNHLYEENLATLHPKPEDMEMYIRQQLYSYEYTPVLNETYKWPERDSRQGFPVPKLTRTSMDEE